MTHKTPFNPPILSFQIRLGDSDRLMVIHSAILSIFCIHPKHVHVPLILTEAYSQASVHRVATISQCLWLTQGFQTILFLLLVQTHNYYAISAVRNSTFQQFKALNNNLVR